jgi:hypothetical protein
VGVDELLLVKLLVRREMQNGLWPAETTGRVLALVWIWAGVNEKKWKELSASKLQASFIHITHAQRIHTHHPK